MSDQRKCNHCEKPITKELSADGLNGFQIMTEIKEAPGHTKKEEACKTCYVKFYKAENNGKDPFANNV